MKTILRLGYLALALAATGGATASDVLVTSVVGPHCEILAGTSSNIDLSGTAVNVGVEGDFVYKCNFVGGNTIVNIKSANGGLLNGSDLVNYGIFLNDQTPAALGAPNPLDWFRASNATGGGVPFPNIVVPAAANSAQTPHFLVGLRAPLTVAGTYTDTLTFTISP